MVKIVSGKMRGRFEFSVRPDNSQVSPPGDEFGNVEGDFEAQFTIWAEVMMLKGTEPVMAQRLSGIQPRVLKVRRSTDTTQITTAWMARDIATNEGLNIRAVTPDPANQLIELLCESGGSAG
jgi:head-tail adaptor